MGIYYDLRACSALMAVVQAMCAGGRLDFLEKPISSQTLSVRIGRPSTTVSANNARPATRPNYPDRSKKGSRHARPPKLFNLRPRENAPSRSPDNLA